MATKIKFHFTFFIFLFFVIYFNSFLLFFAYFISLFIHEYSHYLMSKRYGILSQTLNIYPFGMNINVNINCKNKADKFLIFLIGPLSNILMLLITISLWWCFPISYFYTLDFAIANFALGFFNLIPIYPLDGGNMILSVFNSVESKLKILKIMKIISIVVGGIFLFLFIPLSVYVKINFLLSHDFILIHLSF